MKLILVKWTLNSINEFPIPLQEAQEVLASSAPAQPIRTQEQVACSGRTRARRIQPK